MAPFVKVADQIDWEILKEKKVTVDTNILMGGDDLTVANPERLPRLRTRSNASPCCSEWTRLALSLFHWRSPMRGAPRVSIVVGKLRLLLLLTWKQTFSLHRSNLLPRDLNLLLGIEGLLDGGSRAS